MEDTKEQEWYCYTVARCRGQEDVYSGATNNICRRVRAHRFEVKGGSAYCKRWGRNNAKLVLLVGPLRKTTALSIERYLKNRVGSGVRGRCQALMKLLQLPGGYTAKSARLTASELRQLPVQCSLSQAQFMQYTGTTDEQLDGYKEISFDVEFASKQNESN